MTREQLREAVEVAIRDEALLLGDPKSVVASAEWARTSYRRLADAAIRVVAKACADVALNASLEPRFTSASIYAAIRALAKET